MDTGHGPIHNLDPTMVDAAVSIVRTQGIDALADLLAESDSPLDTRAHQRVLAERPGHAEFEDRKFRSTSPALYAPLATSFTNTSDRLDDLEGLPDTLPTLVIVGEQDQPFLGPSQRMAKAIPDASLVVIPNAGSQPAVREPRRLVDGIVGIPRRSARLTGPP